MSKISILKSSIDGNVILPEDLAYDDSRKVKFNNTAKPLAIVECQTLDDVITVTNFARENHIKLSVRSGGHSAAGLSTIDDGIVISLRLLNKVEVIDADKNLVRVGAGALWGDVARTLQTHNLAISSGDTESVGVGGLTLGGGIGWMVRTFGLSIDRLEAVELVTANGKAVRATLTENADLFWAIRGGGGNFGVATAFEFRAEPCDGVVGGKLFYAATDLKATLKGWAAYMQTAPEKLNSTIVLLPGFGPNAVPQVIVAVSYAGSNELVARKAIQPLRELGTLVREDIKAMPYADMLEEARDVSAMKVRIRNGFVKQISSELIDALAENFGKIGTPMMQIRSLGGAMSRVPAKATAFEHRDVEALIVMNVMLPQTTDDEQATQNAEALWVPIKPFVHGSYIGFQTDNTLQSTHEAYETNLQRLASIKAIYDPHNMFDGNTNIEPLDQTDSIRSQEL